MIIALYFIYFAIGCLVGCFSGLLGVGGGLLVVPILHWIFRSISYTADYHMHVAIATSLAVMVFTSISATYFHAKKGAILWKIFFLMAIGMVIGAVTGPIISDSFSSRVLEIIFGAVEVLVALFLIFKSRPAQKTKRINSRLIYNFVLIIIGFCAAFIGSMLGIGGGIIIVPALIFLGYPSQNAVATSAATLILTAVIGTSAQLIDSYHMNIPYSIGYINIPATISISIGSLIFAPLGVRWAHKLKEEHLKKIFIFVLLTFGVIMIF